MLVSIPSRASQIFRPYFRPIPYPAPAAEPAAIALKVNEAIASPPIRTGIILPPLRRIR